MFFRVGFLFGDWPFDWIPRRFMPTLLLSDWFGIQDE
jgi:hypothetical protein